MCKEAISAIDKAQGVRYTGGVLRTLMVTVAQSAELWIVAPAVVGSSPIGHPFLWATISSPMPVTPDVLCL
jgi:hypothetical protein